MKLKDLVANSLPRVKGRKKKAQGAVCAEASTTEAAAKTEIITGRVSSDKGEARLQAQSCRNDSRDDSFELQGITEASWRGNALYRGLEAARAVKFNSKLMSTSYTSSHGMVTSHSAEGFSTQMMMMSRSYDSRMTVPDCSDSCPQMMSVCETHPEPFSSPQQYYHCHYHQHSHHHYHHHHLHPKPMTPLAQNQQKLYPESAGASCSHMCKAPGEEKPEQGFFRKSFASFRSMRKHSSKSHKDVKQNGVDKTVCSVCPYPEPTASSTEKKSTDKRPAKPKRKSLKGLAKHKENKDMGQSDKSWYSDNDTHNVVSQATHRNDAGVSVLTTCERPHDRERSVESCSSRLYGSREGSCVREVDFTGFDSGSLSGYESDLPRGKVHRSRSRIKTNPWLPSPQPSMSGGGRSEKFDLRESTEDVVKLSESMGRFPRSASFEHQRCATLSMQTSVQKDLNENKVMHRPRSVTPSDIRLAINLTPHEKTASNIAKQTWWSENHVSDESFSLKKTPKPKVEAFNDLNSTVSKSRPPSTVSPNSEFVMLADNLEQLANNISFEYEEMLDTTLESVSICQEDGQTSIQELFTDEENIEVSKSSLKSDGDLHNAHSPDSGVGGLGSTDGDENLVPNSQRLQTDLSMDSLSHAGSIKCFDSPVGSDSNLELAVCSKAGYSRKEKSSADMKCSTFLLSGSCDYNTQTASPKLKIPHDKQCMQDTSSSATLTESDIDNTSYHEVSHNEPQLKKKNTIRLDRKQHNSLSLRHDPELNCISKRATLMVDERLDIQFQPAHRQFHGCGIVMGTGGALHDHSQQVGASGKQMLWKASDSPALFTCRHPRPCAFKTSNGLPVARRMNDIEKSSSQCQQRRSWSVEFDIPRNITITECVESPTENWQCVEGFSGCRSNEALAHSHILPQKSALESRAKEQPEICESSLLQNEELVVNLSSVFAIGHCKHRRNNSSEMVNRMDCSWSKLTTESDSVCSETNDACVQTDFDEDFSRWEEAETLESLEDKALDPAESTRLWLLTGNMQDSADTGYSSLTRESQIFMDEDTLLLAGEVEETAAAERLSFVESSEKAAIGEMGSKDGECHANDPCKSSGFDEKYHPPEATKYTAPAGKELLRQHPGRVSKASYEKKLLSDELLSRSNFSCPQAIHTPRTIPQSTVHRMFSNIESQFQEIFQKIYEDKSNTNSVTKRTSSDSSDSTLKSSNTDDIEDSAVSRNKLEYAKTKDSETSERRTCTDSSVNKDKGSPNTASVSSVSKGCHLNGAKLQAAQCAPNVGESTANKSVEFAKPKHEIQSHGCKRSPFLKAAICSPNASSSSPVPVAHERADYLEFLKDAPLDRLHLKRPLFLVPGVGPVDMSSTEQLNLFADTGMSFKNSCIPGSTVPLSSSPTSMSQSTAHSGKKVKYKKGEYQTAPDYARSKERVAKQHNPVSSRLTNNNPSLPQRRDQPMAPFKDYPVCNPSAQPCGGGPVINETLNLIHNRSINSATSTPKPLHPASPSLLPSSTKTPLFGNKPTAPDERQQKDAAIRNMTERVICLRREKDKVFQKIQEVRHDERLRHQHQLQVQKHLHTQRKEALLETLNDLKHKLEEQSKLLKKKDDQRAHES